MPELHSGWEGNAASRRKPAPAGLILVSPLGNAFLASLSPLGTAGTWLNGAAFLLMVAKEGQQDQPATVAQTDRALAGAAGGLLSPSHS